VRIWLALLLAPILALTDQSVAYAVSGWACANQQSLVLHIVHFVMLVTVLALTVIAWRFWRATGPADAVPHDVEVRHFLAGLATASGTLSSLVFAAMWYPAWILSPCLN